MKKKERLQKFLEEASGFLGKNLTSSDSGFESWNNALIRFVEKEYGKDSLATGMFKERMYTFQVVYGQSHSEYNKKFEKDLNTTIEDLKRLIEECDDEDDINELLPISQTSIQKVLMLMDKFHVVSKQLKKRHDSRSTLIIEDEYDVQDLLHSLLYIYFDDVRAEEWAPSTAGKCSRQDFILKNDNIVIEVKKTRKSLSTGELCDQLLIDIGRYKTHPNCQTIIFFVYDPGEYISNPMGIEGDLTKKYDGIDVIIKIVQK